MTSTTGVLRLAFIAVLVAPAVACAGAPPEKSGNGAQREQSDQGDGSDKDQPRAERRYSDKYMTGRSSEGKQQQPRRDDREVYEGDERSRSAERFEPTRSLDANKPLSEAVQRIVPSRCTTEIADELEDLEVSWAGRGRPWNKVLQGLAEKEDFFVVIDPDGCRVGIAETMKAAKSNAQVSGEDGEKDTAVQTHAPGKDRAGATGDGKGGGQNGDAKGGGQRAATKSAEAQASKGDGQCKDPISSVEAFLNEDITVNLRDATLGDVVRAITPECWRADIQIDDPTILSQQVDLTAQNARGEVLSAISEEIPVRYTPYGDLGLLLVTEEGN